VTFLFNHLISTSHFHIILYTERILLHSAELKNVPDSSSSKKRALAFYEGPHSIQPARLIRRVSSGASVYPPSLIVWENAVDGRGNSGGGSSSAGKGQVRQGSGVGSGARHHASSRGCTNTMCGVPEGPHPGVHATPDNGTTDLNGSKDITRTTPCKIHSNSSSNTTNKTYHASNDDDFLWKKNKLKRNLNGNGYENGNGVSNEGIAEEGMRNGDEDNESDSSLLFTSNCVQHVTTILVDEGDMNPLKVRILTVLIVIYFIEVSSIS
jgi:hypothetical protein